MQRLDNVQKFMIATFSSVFTGYFINSLSDKVKDASLIAFFAIIISILLLSILNFLIENIINKSSLVRKFLLGSDYVEGYWYDITFDNEKKVKWGALLEITFEDGKLKVLGLGYNKNGEKIGAFKSTYSAYHDKILFFEYISHASTVSNFIEIGINQFQFGSPPNTFSGFYIDYTNSLRHLVHGTKVNKKLLKEFNNFNEGEEKKKFILKIIDEHEKSKISQLASE